MTPLPLDPAIPQEEWEAALADVLQPPTPTPAPSLLSDLWACALLLPRLLLWACRGARVLIAALARYSRILVEDRDVE